MQNRIRKEDFKEQVLNVWKLSIPAILTQIASIVMQYIDSAMVGNLGENASASIGLVSTTTWLFGGIITAVAVCELISEASKILLVSLILTTLPTFCSIFLYLVP